MERVAVHAVVRFGERLGENGGAPCYHPVYLDYSVQVALAQVSQAVVDRKVGDADLREREREGGTQLANCGLWTSRVESLALTHDDDTSGRMRTHPDTW